MLSFSDLKGCAREIALASRFIDQFPCKDGGIILISNSSHRVRPRENRLIDINFSTIALLSIKNKLRITIELKNNLLLITYIDMVLVPSLYKIISIEVVFVVQPLSLIPCPLNILLPPPKVIVVIHQAQNQINSILSGLRYHKVQTLRYQMQNQT